MDPRTILQRMLLAVVLGTLLTLIASCIPSSETTKRSADDLRFDIVSTEGRGGYVYVKVKITNVSRQHLNQANVTCLLHDSTGREISFQTHYAVKSTEGGLAPGAKTYFTYVIDSDYSRTASVSFNVKSIK